MISERQKRYLAFYDKKRIEPVDVNDSIQMIKMVVYTLFELYIISDNKSDRMEVAWNIFRLRDDIKLKVKLWDLIEDKNEFNTLIKRKFEQINELRKNNQKRRHEKRDDFALTDKQWEEVNIIFDYKCAYCGEERKLTYDHFYPFSKGGDFMKGNVIPSCTSCNSSKNDKDFYEWYPKQDFFSEDRMNKILNYVFSNRQLTLF